MTGPWHEWLGDNPFLWRDLRRWGKRGYAWKVTLRCEGIPAAVLVGAREQSREREGQAVPAAVPAAIGATLNVGTIFGLMIMFNMGRRALPGVWRRVNDRLAALVGSQLASLLPLSIFAVIARLLWAPQ